MTCKRAALFLGNLHKTAAAAWRHALRQHKLTAIGLATPENSLDRQGNPYDLVLSVPDMELATLRYAVTRLAQHYEIAAILPPPGDCTEDHQSGHAAARLAGEMNLPGFSADAFALAANRYLARCHWQQADLPVCPFSLVQFPSAVLPVCLALGLPVRLSPIHYHLRHLTAHIRRECEATRAYRLIATTLQRYGFDHPAMSFIDGEDPRTRQHLRFSWTSDMLASADGPATPLETTILIEGGQPRVVTCSPITPRHRPMGPKFGRDEAATATELSIEGCKALQIQNGAATCVLQHGNGGMALDGILPNYVDPRIIPAVEKAGGASWPEIMLQIWMRR